MQCSTASRLPTAPQCRGRGALAWRSAQARGRDDDRARALDLHVRRADRRHERRRGADGARSHRALKQRRRQRSSCWSSTRWTWCARSPTASSCCTTASSSPTASPRRSSPRRSCRRLISASRRQERPRMSELLTLSGVQTHIGRYHILHGVDFAVPEGRTDDAARPQRRRQDHDACAPSWACGAPPPAQIRFAGRDIERLRHARHRARRHRPMCRRRWRSSPISRCAKTWCLAARDGPLDQTRLDWIFGFFPALKRFWLSRAGTLSGGQKQMLADRARDGRAAPAPADRRAHQGPCARRSSRALIDCLTRAEGRGATILLVEQNFRVAQQLGDACRVMDNGRIVHAGAMADLAADEAAAAALLGLSLDTHQ